MEKRASGNNDSRESKTWHAKILKSIPIDIDRNYKEKVKELKIIR